MDIFGFFDYKPKDFVNKSVNDILDMKQSKVKENFEKKYETDEVYMNELTEDQKKAIFLLRVLKKGLSKEDKDNIFSLCDIENDNSHFRSKRESMREPSIKKTPKPSRQSSMSPGNKSASQSQPQQTEDEDEYKEPSTEDEEEEYKEPSTEEQPQQTGGKKHKKRKTNRKRKGKKKTQKNNNNK